MARNLYYLFGIALLVSITTFSSISLRDYRNYEQNSKNWQKAENAWQKVQRNSLTPREWGELEIAGELNKSEDLEKNVRRTLTVYNQYYLQKKYLETNAGNVKIRNIGWRDVLDENFVGFDEIKKDIQKNIGLYSQIKNQIKKKRDLELVKKSLSKKSFNDSSLKLFALIIVLVISGLVFNYLFSEKLFYKKVETQTQVKFENVVSSDDQVVWNLAELIEDFCLEIKLKCKSMDVLSKTDQIYVDKSIYEHFELSLKPLVKIIEFLNIKNKTSLHLSLWSSNNKVYLFSDFHLIQFENTLKEHGHLANKLYQAESFLSEEGGSLKVLHINGGNKTRLVLSFNHSSLKRSLNQEITQHSA